MVASPLTLECATAAATNHYASDRLYDAEPKARNIPRLMTWASRTHRAVQGVLAPFDTMLHRAIPSTP